MAEFTMNIDPEYDHILTEHGNTFTALRKIQWTNNSPYKLDLRKWDITSDGDEKCRKGICFDDETANELINVLLSTGYGDTQAVIDSIKDRDDFNSTMAGTLQKDQICLIQKIQDELSLLDKPLDEVEYYDIKGEFIDE